MGNAACTEADAAYIGIADELRAAQHAYFAEAANNTSEASTPIPTPTGAASRGGASSVGGVSQSGYYHSLKAAVFSLDRRTATVRVSTLPLSREAAAGNYQTPNHGASTMAHAATPRTGASARSTGSGTLASGTRRTPVTPRVATAGGAATPPSGTGGPAAGGAGRLAFDDTTAVVVLHIQRRVVGGSDGPAEDPASADEAAIVGNAARSVFTPRGLGEQLSVDLTGLRWRAVHNVPGSEQYEAAVYTLNGRRAHPLVAAQATVAALDLEKATLHDMGFCRYLFHNSYAALRATQQRQSSAGRGGSTNSARLTPVDVSDFLAHTLATTSRSLDISSVSQAVGIVRALFPRSARTPQEPQQTTQHIASLRSVPVSGGGTGTAHPRVPSGGSLPTPRQGGGGSNPQSAQTSQRGGVQSNATGRRTTGSSSAVGSDTQRSGTSEDDLSALGSAGRAPPKLNLTGVGGASGGSRAGAGGPKKPAAMPPIRLAPPGAGAAARGIPPLNSNTSVSPRPGNNQPEVDEDGYPVTDEFDDPQNERVARLRAAAPIASEVISYLFVGGELPAADRPQLISKHVTHIINCANIALPCSFPDLFEYQALRLSDSPDEPIFDLFPQVVGYIERAFQMGGRTLVHCHQGVSRSCSFVIAYTMWKQGLCYDAAYDLVREKRRIASPNPGFMVNLLRWERRMRQPDAVHLFRFGPYSLEYATPYLFRDMAIYDKLDGPCDPKSVSGRHGAQLLGGDVSTLDPRHVYLLVDTNDRQPEALLLVGDQVPAEVAKVAPTAAKTLLAFGYYGNKPSFSEDRRGNRVQYSTCYVSVNLTMGRDTPTCTFSATTGVDAIQQEVAPYAEALRRAGCNVAKSGRLFSKIETVEELSPFHTPDTLDAFREAESTALLTQRKALRRRRCRDAVFRGEPMPAEFSDSEDAPAATSPPPNAPRRRADDQTRSTTTDEPPRLARRPEEAEPAAAAAMPNSRPAIPPLLRGERIASRGEVSSDASVDDGDTSASASHPTVRAIAIRTDSKTSNVSSPPPVSDATSVDGQQHSSVADGPDDEDDDQHHAPPHDDDDDEGRRHAELGAGFEPLFADADLPEDRVVVLNGSGWSEVPDFFDFDDLEGESSVAVFARPRPNSEEVPQVFLWIGQAVLDEVGEDEAIPGMVESFDDACRDRAQNELLFKLRNSVPFAAVDIEVVLEDDEPDNFVACFN